MLELYLPLLSEKIIPRFSNEDIHVFSFPYMEKTNVLLHSVTGHEIGHFYHAEWKGQENIEKKFSNIYDELLKWYQENESDLIKPVERAQHGLNIITGMCREIYSDIIGYYIFGPAMLYSLFYISIFEKKILDPSKENNYYPSIKYRIRFLYDKFYRSENIFTGPKENADNNKIIDSIQKELKQYLHSQEDVSVMKKYEKEKEVFETLTNNFLSFISKPSENFVSLENFTIESEKTKYLLNSLRNGLPINEYNSKPNEMNEILFVGWLKFFENMLEFHTDEYTTEYQKLMRLLLISLNSSYIQRKYMGGK